jgi:hypothetical protein
MARALEIPLHVLFHDGENPIEKLPLQPQDGHDGRLWGSPPHERSELQQFAKALARMTDRQRNLLMATARDMNDLRIYLSNYGSKNCFRRISN